MCRFASNTSLRTFKVSLQTFVKSLQTNNLKVSLQHFTVCRLTFKKFADLHFHRFVDLRQKYVDLHCRLTLNANKNTSLMLVYEQSKKFVDLFKSL